MTRAQRCHHLLAWLLLGPAILGVLVAALSVRSSALWQRPPILQNPPENRP